MTRSPGGTDLSAVAKLAPHNALSRSLQVTSRVDYARVLATELSGVVTEAL